MPRVSFIQKSIIILRKIIEYIRIEQCIKKYRVGIVGTVIPESELIIKVKSGNSLAYDELMQRYYKKAFAVALRYTGNDDDAKDVVQDTFLKVYNNFDLFDQTRSFNPWFFKILINICKNHLRSQKIKRLFFPKRIEDEFYSEAGHSNDSVNESVNRHERKALIDKALSKIPEAQRMAIILFELEGFSLKEVAEILKIPVGSVMSKLFYGRRKLRKLLEGKI